MRENLQKLLAELHDVPAEFRQARYHCVIAFVRRHDDSSTDRRARHLGRAHRARATG